MVRITRQCQGQPWSLRSRRWVQQWIRYGLVSGLSSLSVLGQGCSPAGPDDSKLPPEVQDPKALQTPAGALELYRGALQQLPRAFDQTMVTGAILTDELAALPLPPSSVGFYTALDSRQILTEEKNVAYSQLHRARAQLREARGFLAAYATDTATARELQGHLYAQEGYADLLLAELFCSGVPLSTVDFQGDYTLAAGSRTSEVYRTAIALFDSALTLTHDSVVFQHLAALGRGRTLLALGVYDSAALAVAAVPTDYRYRVTIGSWSMGSFVAGVVSGNISLNYTTAPGFPSLGDREGLNGLDYLSSGDPRTAGTLQGPDFYGHPFYFPTKYTPISLEVTLTLADGIEARLIEAEAALQGQFGGADWLTILNTLRTDGTFHEEPTADPDDDPAATDTIWHAGSGGQAGLAPLVDPGTAEARLDLLFRERAFWLYLTAHRLGDLRRLIRQYGRAPDAVYPTGSYSGGTGTYGIGLVVPVPKEEQQLNPKYSGCFHLGA